MTKKQQERALEFVRVLASYGCASVNQEENNAASCGKCGPCEARAFVQTIDNRLPRI